MTERKESKIEFVGTLRDRPFPILTENHEEGWDDDYTPTCDCPQCRDFTNIDRCNSGLIVNDSVMVNMGEYEAVHGSQAYEFIRRYDDLHAIVFTSPYYMKGVTSLLKNSLTRPVHMLESIPHDFYAMYNERLIPWFDRMESHAFNEPFHIGETKLEFVPVWDSLSLRIAGLRIDDHILYTPDFITMWVDTKRLLDGVDTWITDGASLREDVVEEHYPDGVSISHMSMFNQMQIADSHMVPAVLFTHIGHVEKSHERLKKDLFRYMKQRTTNLRTVDVVKEGEIYGNTVKSEVEKDNV